MKIICDIYNEQGSLVQSIPVKDKTVIIGRDPGSGIRINDRRVSRRHARIEFSSKGWNVTDLNSTNGTFLNNRKLIATDFFSEKDELSIGNHLLKFRTTEAPAATEPAKAMVLSVTLSSDGKERTVETLPLYICFNRENGNMNLTSDPYHPDNLVKISLTAHGFVIHNMFEKNFVFLNGRPFTKAALKSGDTVRIGNQNCLLELKPQDPVTQVMTGGTSFPGEADQPRKNKIWKWLAIAAILLLVLGLSGYGFYQLKFKPQNPSAGVWAVLEDSLTFRPLQNRLMENQQNLRSSLNTLFEKDSLDREFESQLELLGLDSYFLGQVNIPAEQFADTITQFSESRRWLLRNKNHWNNLTQRLERLNALWISLQTDSTHTIKPEETGQIKILTAEIISDSIFADSLLQVIQNFSEAATRMYRIIERENSQYVEPQWQRHANEQAVFSARLKEVAQAWNESFHNYCNEINRIGKELSTPVNKENT